MSTSDADSATKSRSPLSLPVVSLIEYSCVLLFEANDSALDTITPIVFGTYDDVQLILLGQIYMYNALPKEIRHYTLRY